VNTIGRRSISVYALLLLCAHTLSCDSSTGAPTGRYVSTTDPTNYIELKRNGTFDLFGRGGGAGFHGTYKLDGNILTIELPNGNEARMTLSGDTIIVPPPDDGIYVRSSPLGAIALGGSKPLGTPAGEATGAAAAVPEQSVSPDSRTALAGHWEAVGASDCLDFSPHGSSDSVTVAIYYCEAYQNPALFTIGPIGTQPVLFAGDSAIYLQVLNSDTIEVSPIRQLSSKEGNAILRGLQGEPKAHRFYRVRQ
jgi:hypothetical protein